MIHFDHVNLTYENADHPALSDCSFDIEKGQTVLLAGMSGCGKSTILNLINGLLLHDEQTEVSGTIQISGKAAQDLEQWEVADLVGSVFQNPKSQFFNLTVADEIIFGLENRGATRPQMERALARAAEVCGVQDLLGRDIFGLSGGEKQRIACASAYATDPDVLVLDEPSANLDEQSIEALAKVLAEWKRQGKTVVIAEHQLWYALDIVDEVFYIRDGHVERTFTPDQLRFMDAADRAQLGLRQCTRPPDIAPEPGPVGDDGIFAQGLTTSNKRIPVWQNIDFHIPRGRVCAITGKNGAGKTTLARVLCGLKKTNAGTLNIDGQVAKRKQLRARSFMVMQDVNAQLFGETALDEVTFGDESLKDQAYDALERLGLGGYAKRNPSTLSGGQRQRLAVADALVSKRDIIVLDEPTSGLDLRHMQQVSDALHQMALSDKCVVVITHDMEFVHTSNALVINWGQGR